MSDFSTATPDQTLAEVHALQERVRQQEQVTAKWGRMLNALVEVLGEKGLAGKDELMAKVYERLEDSGALERAH
jgi:hypothetical protein